MAQISFAVTAKLVCAFVFAYANCWFSYAAAQISKNLNADSKKKRKLFTMPTIIGK